METCQIDWVMVQQVQYETYVYMVEDPAKQVMDYGFQAVCPRYLMNLEDFCYHLHLTKSWHFRWKLSHMAIIKLFTKEYCLQTTTILESGCWKGWIPYQTWAGFPFPSKCRRMEDILMALALDITTCHSHSPNQCDIGVGGIGCLCLCIHKLSLQ